MTTPTTYLKRAGIDIFLKGHNSYKLESAPFMALTVETWQQAEFTMVSMCHYGEQNGDLMKDPDVLFRVKGDEIVYREIQMDYTGYYSENHAEIKDFVENTWVDNLINQGQKLTEKEIENWLLEYSPATLMATE